jgi:hypothetical protein
LFNWFSQGTVVRLLHFVKCSNQLSPKRWEPRPTNFLRWIEFIAVRISEEATKFLPLHGGEGRLRGKASLIIPAALNPNHSFSDSEFI